jgi:hypothetical protein
VRVYEQGITIHKATALPGDVSIFSGGAFQMGYAADGPVTLAESRFGNDAWLNRARNMEPV